MTETQDAKIFEGTWEEISLRADELKGRRVMVTVFAAPQAEGKAANGTSNVATTEETLAEAIERIGTFDGPPSDVARDGKRLWGEGVEEKHRRIKERFAERVAKEAGEPSPCAP